MPSPHHPPGSADDGNRIAAGGPPPRLKAGIVASAVLREAQSRGCPAFQRRRGDADAGAILVKLDGGRARCVVLAQARTARGEAAWVRVTGSDPVDEATAEACLDRAIRRDPDLWVLEIEDPGLTPPGDGPVI